LNLNVEGVVPAINTAAQTELIVCALDTAFVQEVMEEQGPRTPKALREQIGFQDDALAGLVRLVEAEAKSGGESGRMYLDHLTYSLVFRVLSLGMKPRDSSIQRGALPFRHLKRVIERMEADLETGVALKTLADDCGYSRNHFLRMFRAATGYSPHQYLVRLRIRKAEAMMRSKSVELIQIALACGFSSHGHLSRVFRTVTGMSPSEYRRNMV
jgi:AraC family transcriptional regulator